MTRCITVYALNNIEDMAKAITLLNQTAAFLPEGAVLKVYRVGDADLPESETQSWLFGDLVQVIDFPMAHQATQFQSSDAFKRQSKAAADLFSNIISTSF
jgi:hypothetical protein